MERYLMSMHRAGINAKASDYTISQLLSLEGIEATPTAIEKKRNEVLYQICKDFTGLPNPTTDDLGSILGLFTDAHPDFEKFLLDNDKKIKEGRDGANTKPKREASLRERMDKIITPIINESKEPRKPSKKRTDIERAE